jgi:uncharacterized protein DUF6851
MADRWNGLLHIAGSRGLLVLLLLQALFPTTRSSRVGAQFRQGVVVQWDGVALQGIRDSKLAEPMVSRALAIVHTCMYDAWAAYDERAVATQLGGALRRPAGERTLAIKQRAISYAAFRALSDGPGNLSMTGESDVFMLDQKTCKFLIPRSGFHEKSFRRRGHRAKRGTPAFLLVILCLFPLLGLNSQINPVESRLIVSPEGQLSEFWRVSEAGLREELSGTTGYLKIQNISVAPIDDAAFYAEYFDSEGRLCFTLVLSQARNSAERGPIAPGEMRTIGSIGAGLFPASEPKEVRVHLLQLRSPGQTDELRKWDGRIRAPVTLSGGIQSGLQLSTETGSAKEPVLDLILASVSVNDEGQVTNVDVLRSANSRAESWFRDFAQRATFYPATDAGRPQNGQALLMVRAALGQSEGGQIVFTPPQLSPWVRLFLQSTNTDLCPVTNVLLGRPATRINRLKPTGETVSFEIPPAPRGIFQLAFQDTYWSSPAVQWVIDESMPRHMRRELPDGNQP